MGEIRVKVMLSNYVDEVRAKHGDIEPSSVRKYEADAVVDTGAVASVLPIHVSKLLGLETNSYRVAEMADGSQVNSEVVGGINFEIMERKTMDEAFVLGSEVLIGQTVLEKLDLLADCKNRRLIPNPANPDQPVLKIK